MPATKLPVKPASPPPEPTSSRPKIVKELEISAYDRVASMLVAVLILLGFIVLLMILAWLSMRLTFKRPVVQVTVVEGLGGGGRGSGSPGPQESLDEVTPEEVADLQEVNVEQTLKSINSAVSDQLPNLDAIPGTTGLGNGEGTGLGDGRGAGPGGPGTATELPDWEVRFNAKSLDAYAKQIDFFGIELAAVGGGKKTVEYASNLAKPKPEVREADGAKENRRYLLWRKGTLAAADKALLKKAKIDATGRVVLQFLPPPTENRMAQLEAEYAKGKKLSQIRRTVFGVKGTEDKYEFFVLEQNYR